VDGITSASPLAFLGSLLAHAAFGAAVIGFGPASAPLDAPNPRENLVFFEAEQPVVAAVAPVVPEELPVVRRAARVAPPPAAPAPVAEPAEQAPPVEAPVVGVPSDVTVGAEAKGFEAGASGVGAKTGGAQPQAGVGAVSLRGVTGGTGNRARAAGLADGRNWDCPFPQQAEEEGIDGARVTLEVLIGADNAVSKATVVSDPGYGFAQEARRCALRRRWLSQLDSQGAPITGRATVVVNFVR